MARRSWPFVLAVLACGPAAARADEPAKPPAEKPAEKPSDKPAPEKVSTDAEAKDALERFAREFETEDLALRIDALKRLCRLVHATVADRLLALAFKHEDMLVRSESFKGLARQKPFAKTVAPKVARWLGEAAEENRKAKARGDYGLKIDIKTGEVDTQSPEGQAALKKKKERGRMLSEALRLIRDWEYRDRESVEVLLEFLQDGNDDLVAFVLDCFGRWKEWTVLPEMLDLFEMYPEEDRYETGSTSVDTGSAGSADQQAAKRKWMAKYGDPDKRRPRPKVVQAIKRNLKEITGQEFKKPAELRDYMKKPEVKRKVRG
jgi:hypothetical protein